MDTLSIPNPRALFLLAFAAGTLWAQAPSSPQPKTEAAYLLRLERVGHRQGVCVLLRGDGQYHLEHHAPDKVRVLEGFLDAQEMGLVVHIVSGDQLYRLEQKQITDPMLKSEDDQVILAVLRPHDIWQQLLFPDPLSREPYRESLVPLLEWLDRLQKRKGRELSEDEGRNNCQPFAIPELVRRPAKKGEPHTNRASAASAPIAGNIPGVAGPGPPRTKAAGDTYVLRFVDSAFVKGTMEMSCTLVTPSGTYHFVKQSREFGAQKVRSVVLDGNLDNTQIAALRQLLDAPELRTPPSDPRSQGLAIPTGGGPTETFVWFPRDGIIQKFEAWHSLQVVAGKVTQNVQEHGMTALLPLRQWLNLNLDESKAVPTVNPSNAKCMPEL
jgi:hypothetical protein